MQAYGYYSIENVKRRQLARERAIAWKVIKTTAKAFLLLAVAGVIAIIACYHLLVWTIDGQIDQSNIQNCEDLRTVQLEQWQKQKGECQAYYNTGKIEYMRKYHAELDR